MKCNREGVQIKSEVGKYDSDEENPGDSEGNSENLAPTQELAQGYHGAENYSAKLILTNHLLVPIQHLWL